MVHSNSNVKEPVKQGLWGIFEVFADTIIVCTMTAIVCLSSGFIDSSSKFYIVTEKDLFGIEPERKRRILIFHLFGCDRCEGL